MSYLENRLRALPVALLMLAIYIALPNALTRHYGEATFTVLLCVGLMLYTSPATYFRRDLPGWTKRKKRNLAANWAGLLASTAVATAVAQHESGTGQVVRWGRRDHSAAMLLGLLAFLVTYFVLWLGYHLTTRHRHSKPARSTAIPDSPSKMRLG